MGVIEQLFKEALSTINPTVLNTLWTMIAIICGISFGSLIALLSFYVSKSFNTGHLDQQAMDSSVSEYITNLDNGHIMGDCIGDTISGVMGITDKIDNLGNTTAFALVGTFYFIPIMPVFSSVSLLFIYFLCGTHGLWSFTVSYSITIFVTLRVEEYRYTIAHIKRIIEEMPEVNEKDSKIVAKTIYKSLRDWLKPGRSNKEFFFLANGILEEFVNSKESLMTLGQ